jgi:dynein light chain LC8-type
MTEQLVARAIKSKLLER